MARLLFLRVDYAVSRHECQVKERAGLICKTLKPRLLKLMTARSAS
jgi:hypothetical protein